MSMRRFTTHPMTHRLISHRAINLRPVAGGNPALAGRRLPFFRPTAIAFLLLAFLPLFSGYSQSPEPNEDSLLAAIETLAPGQRAELQALLTRHRSLLTPGFWKKLMARATSAYGKVGVDRSLHLYDAAIEIAQTLNDRKRLGASWYGRGLALSGAGRTQEAIGAYFSAKQFYEESGAWRDVIYVLSDLGTLYLVAENYN